MVERIDNAVAQYYKDCGRNDYFNEERQGKFREFYDDSAAGYDTDTLDYQLRDDANDPRDCLFVYDPMFPLPIVSTNESRANDIFQILKYCHKYGVAPFALNW
eukprot:730252_1